MDPHLSPLSYVTLVARRSPSVRAGVVTVRRQRGRGWAFRPAAWRRPTGKRSVGLRWNDRIWR